MTQLATQKKDIRALVNSYQEQFRMALPKLITPERFTRVALTAINKTPKLAECTQESLLACLLDCAALGIEPDGRRAHLIPYGTKCTLIIDYKGIAELVRRSGDVATLHAGIVYPSDDFDYAFGTGQFLRHKPSLAPRGEEKPILAYSYVKLKDGQEDFDVMSIEDVEKIRGRSRSGSAGPWVTDFDEMAKKTVFRRHSKWLPLSPELRDKIEVDDEPMTSQERFASAKPVSAIQFGEAQIPVAPDPKLPVREELTALEQLRRLLKNVKIAEGELVSYLGENGRITDGVQTLEMVPPDVLQDVIGSFVEIADQLPKEF